MKNKLILSLLVIFVFSCSTDSVSEDTDTTNFEVTQLDGDLNLKSSNSENTSNATKNPSNIDLRALEGNTNLINDDFNNQTSSFGIQNVFDGNSCPFVTPIEIPGQYVGNYITIRYNQFYVNDAGVLIIIPEEEINCIRQEFFTALPCIRMAEIQNDDDPYTDRWFVINGDFHIEFAGCSGSGTTGGLQGSNSVENEVADDERVNMQED